MLLQLAALNMPEEKAPLMCPKNLTSFMTLKVQNVPPSILYFHITNFSQNWHIMAENQHPDSIVTNIPQNTQNIGEPSILESPKSQGLRVKCWQVRRSLQ